MKVLFPILILALCFTACDNSDDIITPTGIPVVQSISTYDIITEEGITYAEGLSHESLNSTNSTTIPLKLDAFVPDNDTENRPAIMLIHGGGFIGGSRTQEQIVNMAKYFAERGWVAFSIDYRLRDDYGTIPSDWVNFSNNFGTDSTGQFLAIYPAHRDAKAALRWVVANAATYNINTDYLTVGGGSAGAVTAIGISIGGSTDFTDELSLTEDPTLSTTNREQTYQVKTILDFWGSKVSLDAYDMVYGRQYFGANNPPILIAHGTEDPTVAFSGAEDLKAIYDANGVPNAYYPLEGKGHGVWNATVNGKRLEELSFDFIVEQQELTVE